jgi:hypothetical protein
MGQRGLAGKVQVRGSRPATPWRQQASDTLQCTVASWAITQLESGVTHTAQHTSAPPILNLTVKVCCVCHDSPNTAQTFACRCKDASTTQSTLGFRLCGMVVQQAAAASSIPLQQQGAGAGSSSAGHRVLRRDRHWGKQLTADTMADALRSFADNGEQQASRGQAAVLCGGRGGCCCQYLSNNNPWVLTPHMHV